MINPALMELAEQYNAQLARSEKQAFIDAGAMQGMPPGGGGMDPAMMGGAPGGAPPGAQSPGAAPPGGDPAAAGGTPGPLDPGIISAIQQAVTQAMGGAGGGAGGGMGIKPKIDVNVSIMQISKILARMADVLGVQIPASEMIATPGDLNSMAAQQTTASTAGAGAPPPSAIPPVEPMQGASPALAAGAAGGGGGGMKTGGWQGEAFESQSPVLRVSDRAAALADVLSRAR